MLAAAAAIVLTAGATGFLGPLGSLISGSGARSATEGPAAAGAAGTPVAAIVAAPLSATVAAPGARRRSSGRGRGPGGRGPSGGGRGPGSPNVPSGPAPGPSGGGGGGAPGGGGGPPGGGGGGGPVVQTLAGAVQQVQRQAPPAAQPLTGQLDRVTGALSDACRRLPVCP
jgi:hypothetical protein